jgi:uncharacterized protein
MVPSTGRTAALLPTAPTEFGSDGKSGDFHIQQVIVQPTSGCNLNCSYCYVPDRRDYSKMDDSTLEAIISGVLQSEFVHDEVDVVWHAGEPLTAGIKFYERAVKLIRSNNSRQISVKNYIQTNGTLVDEEWCRFFSDNGFMVGVSLDGPAFLHDRTRRGWTGRGSHREALRGFQRLRSHGLSPGIICVLTRESLKYPLEICSFFLDIGTEYLCFNLEETENMNRQSSFSLVHASVSPEQLTEEYMTFMSKFFDAWRPHATRMVVREFRDMASSFYRVRLDPCHHTRPMETVDFAIITIQKNGDVSSFSPELAGATSLEFGNFVLGNIKTNTLRSIVTQDAFLNLRSQVAQSVANCRSSCEYFAVCGGGFISNKYAENGSITSTETITCLLHRQALASVLLDKLTLSGAAPR